RKATRAPLAQATRDDRRCGLRLQPLQLAEGAAERVLVVRVGPRERGFVWTPRLVPESSRVRPVPRLLPCVRLREDERDLLVDACAGAPSEHLAESHCVSLVAGHVEHVPGRRKYSFPVAFEPGDLGLRGRDGAQTSPLTGRLAQCPCLVEEFLVA